MRTPYRPAPATPQHPATATIDVRAAWRALSPERQEHIGLAALITGIGTAGEAVSNAVGFEAASVAGLDALADIGRAVMAGTLRRPDLSPLGIRCCRVCGCTDAVGCEGGCSWVGPDLCSRCADDSTQESKEETCKSRSN